MTEADTEIPFEIRSTNTGFEKIEWFVIRGGERIHHRMNGPALVTVDKRDPNHTTTGWYRDGKLHREDGPAWVWNLGDGAIMFKYYRDGELHREDGPAEASFNFGGDGETEKKWYRDGKLHREDGPAVIGSGDDDGHYLCGERIPDKWVKQKTFPVQTLAAMIDQHGEGTVERLVAYLPTMKSPSLRNFFASRHDQTLFALSR